MVLGAALALFGFQASAGFSAILLLKLFGLLILLLGALGGGIYVIRRFFRDARREIEGPSATVRQPRANDQSAFMVATFQQVIQQMREQEKELERLHRMERQRAEESQQLAATIMKNMATGLVMLNARGVITECNPAAKAVLGHQLLAGRGYREILWPEQQGSDPLSPGMVELEECLREGTTTRRLQMTYRAPGGPGMVLGMGCSPIRGADGSIGGAIVLLTDLTEITALQQQIRLKENLAALGEMSAGIAHEFKNALATISGYGQLMQSATPEEARSFAAKIVSETQLLSTIVTDFLSFSRPLNLVAVPVACRELVEDSFSDILERGTFPGITLELRGEFPVIQADITRLRQAFSNLLRNGCEAMAEKGGPGRMRVESQMEATEGKQTVTLRFHDEGQGIAPENMEKVFIPFFTTKNAGTGLGLALVHKIVVNHNGKVEVESSAEKGTTFSVTLPLTT